MMVWMDRFVWFHPWFCWAEDVWWIVAVPGSLGKYWDFRDLKLTLGNIVPTATEKAKNTP